jgi:hypothetical protein
MTTKEYIVMQKASPVVSVLEDIFSFGGFVLVLWFNHAVLNGNGWLDFLFIILWISTVTSVQSRRYHKFNDPKDAIKYLEGKK